MSGPARERSWSSQQLRNSLSLTLGSPRDSQFLSRKTIRLQSVFFRASFIAKGQSLSSRKRSRQRLMVWAWGGRRLGLKCRGWGWTCACACACAWACKERQALRCVSQWSGKFYQGSYYWTELEETAGGDCCGGDSLLQGQAYTFISIFFARFCGGASAWRSRRVIPRAWSSRVLLLLAWQSSTGAWLFLRGSLGLRSWGWTSFQGRGSRQKSSAPLGPTALRKSLVIFQRLYFGKRLVCLDLRCRQRPGQVVNRFSQKQLQSRCCGTTSRGASSSDIIQSQPATAPQLQTPTQQIPHFANKLTKDTTAKAYPRQASLDNNLPGISGHSRRAFGDE